MIEKLDGLSVESKVMCMFIEKEVNGMGIQFERQGLKEGDVVGHNLFVREVKLVNNNGVDMVVGQEVICIEINKLKHYYLNNKPINI